MPTFKLPDPYVGGERAAHESPIERFEGIQRNFEALERFLSAFAGFFYWGDDDPENLIVASPPAVYLRRTGGTSTTWYIKETGTDTDTGWVAK